MLWVASLRATRYLWDEAAKAVILRLPQVIKTLLLPPSPEPKEML